MVNNMRIRQKINAALKTAIIFTICFFLLTIITAFFTNPYDIDGSLLFAFIVVFIYSLIGNLVFGLPVSLISDVISERFMNIRLLLSAVIHIGFGLLPFILTDIAAFGIPSVICSVIFLISDETLKRRS